MMDSMDGFDGVELIKEQIEYDALAYTYPAPKLDCIVQILCGVLHGNKTEYVIDGTEIDAEEVKKKFRTISRAHVEYVFDSIGQSKSMVKNWPRYLLTALYHAPDTMDFYYEAWVRHDMAEGG